MTAATTKPMMKSGTFTFPSDFVNQAPKRAEGIIQSALVNLTVVPIARAREPYAAAAPTTLLVS